MMRMIGKPASLYRTLCLIPLGLLILALVAIPTRAGAQDASEGEKLFTSKACKSCHTIGGGKLVGPDLLGVTTRRDRAWLTRWIKEPDKVLAEGDATATQLYEEYNKIPMTNLGLIDGEVAAVIAYLVSIVTGGAPAPAPAAPALPAGDLERGKALFLGTTRLANGGPACMVCHSVTGIGALGGGALGPDLTDVFNRYGGQAGLAAFLGSPATITMNAIWANQPMTDQERADLVAVFATTTTPLRTASTLWTLAGLSGAGGVVLLASAQVWWRKRLMGVRRPMVARANAKK